MERTEHTSPAAAESPPATTTAQVTLPYRGTLRVCASTTVKLAVDSSVPAGEVPGLLIALDHGAVEMSFADTPRKCRHRCSRPTSAFSSAAQGAADVKVRLGAGSGDTCVDNAGANAPYVVVTSVFDSGALPRAAGPAGDVPARQPARGGGPGEGTVWLSAARRNGGERVSAGQSEGLAPNAAAAQPANQPAASAAAARRWSTTAPITRRKPWPSLRPPRRASRRARKSCGKSAGYKEEARIFRQGRAVFPAHLRRRVKPARLPDCLVPHDATNLDAFRLRRTKLLFAEVRMQGCSMRRNYFLRSRKLLAARCFRFTPSC